MQFYARDGSPIDLWTWARLFGTYAYKVVARTTVTSAADASLTYDVSTIWLGDNHRFGPGPPLIFETMVFGDTSEDLDTARYSTEQQARDGHVMMVTTVAATLKDPIVMDVPTEHDPDCLHCRSFPDEGIRTSGVGSEDTPVQVEPTDVDKTLADIDALPATPSE